MHDLSHHYHQGHVPWMYPNTNILFLDYMARMSVLCCIHHSFHLVQYGLRIYNLHLIYTRNMLQYQLSLLMIDAVVVG